MQVHGWIFHEFVMNLVWKDVRAVYEMLTFHIQACMNVIWILREIFMKRMQISWTK